MALRVELDLFSGSPNPSWLLEPHEVEELERMLASHPESALEPPGLGYRGFVLESAPRRRVYGKIDVERWLLAHARGRIDARFCDIVADALAQRR